MGKTIEINDPITFQLVSNEYAKIYQAYFSLKEKEIRQNTFDALKFTNIILGDTPAAPSDLFESATIYILNLKGDRDFLLTNTLFTIDGFSEFKLTKAAADLLHIPVFSQNIVGGFTTLGATEDARIGDININLKSLY